MVNTAKRVRSLMVKLFNIRNGPAAVPLPPPPRPQLKSVYMRIPTGAWPKGSTDAEGQSHSQPEPFIAVQGARKFWRQHLKRLKYRNPALDVTVETIAKNYSTPTYMSLRFDSPDRAALQRINAKYDLLERTAMTIKVDTGVGEDEGAAAAAAAEEEKQTRLIEDAARSKRDAEAIEHAPEDTVAAAPQPAADPSRPSSTSPPPTLYTRTVTLPLTSFPTDSIWQWFRQTTGCADSQVDSAELEEHQKLEAWLNGPSQRDRERVRAGREAKKKEEAELKKAREAAQRLSEQAI